MSRQNNTDRFKLQVSALRTDFRSRLCASRRDIRKVYGVSAWNKARILAARIVEELSSSGLRKDTHALLIGYGLTRRDINFLVATTTKCESDSDNDKLDVIIAGIVPAFRTVLKVVTCCGYSPKRGLYGWFTDCGESRSGIDVHLVAEWRYQNQF